MKLLIGNSGAVPADRAAGVDTRAWAQRVLWLADESDVVVLSDGPDAAFLGHVCAVKGLDIDRLAVVVAPEGRYGPRMIDPMALLAPGFTQALAARLRGAAPGPGVSEVFPLYPDAAIAELAAELGVEKALPAAEFLRQGGARLADSKATFRAVAAGAGVAVAPGRVCHARDEATYAVQRLMAGGGGVMVKRVHGAGGQGNEIVIAEGDPVPAQIGARQVRVLPDRSATAVRGYWDERWEWASENGRQPVVVEGLLDVRDCLYTEFFVGDDRVEMCEAGSVSYGHGRIVREVVGIDGVPEDAADRLLSGSRTLVECYRRLGYRGYIDVDAILVPTGRLFFAEVNARTTSGTWLQRLLAEPRMAGGSDRRTVRQENAPSAWGRPTTAEFAAVLAAGGLSYDRSTGSGVLLAAPTSGGPRGPAARYALVAPPHRESELAEALDQAFRSAAKPARG